jgi:hypothetical protein
MLPVFVPVLTSFKVRELASTLPICKAANQ